MLRAIGILFSVVLMIGAAVVTWPQFFRVEDMFPFAQLVSLRPILFLVFLGIAVISLLLLFARPIRGFAATLLIIAILGAGANGAILGMRGVIPTALPAATDSSIRVMTWNTAGTATPAENIAQTAVDMQADVVSLPETSEEIGADVAVQMRELGRPMWVHHVSFHDDIAKGNGPLAWQTTILISPELGDYFVMDASSDGSSNTGTVPSVVAMPTSGDGPIIVAVHAVAPRPEAMDGWRSDLEWIADQCPDTNVILAGDFNATVDNMAKLGVGDADLGYCFDSASRTGTGGVGTWPTSLPALLGSPIDHVMASKHWEATGSVVLTEQDNAGSDHRPLIVQLERTNEAQ